MSGSNVTWHKSSNQLELTNTIRRPHSSHRTSPIPPLLVKTLSAEFPVTHGEKTLSEADPKTKNTLESFPPIVEQRPESPVKEKSISEETQVKPQVQVAETVTAPLPQKSLAQIAGEIKGQLLAEKKPDIDLLEKNLKAFFEAAKTGATQKEAAILDRFHTSLNIILRNLKSNAKLNPQQENFYWNRFKSTMVKAAMHLKNPDLKSPDNDPIAKAKNALRPVVNALKHKEAMMEISPALGNLRKITSDDFIENLKTDTQHTMRSKEPKKSKSLMGTLRSSAAHLRDMSKDSGSVFNKGIVNQLAGIRTAKTLESMISMLETVEDTARSFTTDRETKKSAKITHSNEILESGISETIVHLKTLSAKLDKISNTLSGNESEVKLSQNDLKLLLELSRQTEFPALQNISKQLLTSENCTTLFNSRLDEISQNLATPEKLSTKDLTTLRLLSKDGNDSAVQDRAKEILLQLRTEHHIVVGENLQMFKIETPDKPLARGGFGAVYTAINLETGQRMALKQIVQEDPETTVDDSRPEYELFNKAPQLREGEFISPNVDYVIMENGQKKELFIAMPLLKTELKDAIKQMPVPERLQSKLNDTQELREQLEEIGRQKKPIEKQLQQLKDEYQTRQMESMKDDERLAETKKYNDTKAPLEARLLELETRENTLKTQLESAFKSSDFDTAMLAELGKSFNEGDKTFQVEMGLKILDMLQALKELHDANVAHTDIQHNNFMVDENGRLRLFDFGTACYEGRQELDRVVSKDITQEQTIFVRNNTRVSPEMVSMQDRQWAEKNDTATLSVLTKLEENGLLAAGKDEIEKALTPEEFKVIKFTIGGQRSLTEIKKDIEEKMKGVKTHSLPKVDVWDLGVMLFEMLDGQLHGMRSGRFPFELSIFSAKAEDPKAGPGDKIKAVHEDISNNYPADSLMNLIAKMLIKDHTKRPSVDELLNHPFLQAVRQQKAPV